MTIDPTSLSELQTIYSDCKTDLSSLTTIINEANNVPTSGFYNYPGKRPSINTSHPCASGLLWDGLDIGVGGAGNIVELVNGDMCPPMPQFSPSQFPALVQTQYGEAFEWTSYTGNQQGSNGYGALGWLDLNSNALPDETNPIREALTLQGKAQGTGFTIACTCAVTDLGGSGNIAPPWIFGRFLNAGEAPSAGQIVPFATGAFVQTGYMSENFGFGVGSNEPSIGFVWDNNGSINMINWTTNPPSKGEVVALVATAQVQSDGTATVTLWAGPVGGTPTQIGQVTGQILNDAGSGNNEDQIGWAGIVHWQTGSFLCVHWGNQFRGSINNTVWGSTAIADYIANPDCFHNWS